MSKGAKCILWCVAMAGMVACSNPPVVQSSYGIIPLPQEISMTDGAPFVLTPATPVVCPKENEGLKQTGTLLVAYLQEKTGYTLRITDKQTTGAIRLSVDESITHPEGYNLTIGADGIQLVGADEAGLFYGIQTLRKSLPTGVKGVKRIVLPAATINDYPRFAYRGMHLDVSRHFFPADSIKKYIDILALHNMNTLHWHLTDDQGWRFESKKYPRLTTVGAQRKETVIGRNSGNYDGKPYGGFYTQEEIRDVVAYARQRFITVVPEIDLPGHQQAALAAYPELGCTGGPYEVWTQWGVSDDVICAGNDQAMAFLEDILGEVIDLFPSEYIHIGGDECPKIRWKTCPKCQARIRTEGLGKGDHRHTAEAFLQSYVIRRMEQFVESKGRHIIGWDEILEGGLAPNATVMSWRGVAGGIEAAKQKHPVIMTPNSHLYFDYYQSADTENEPLAIGGYLPVEKVYALEPTAGIPDAYTSYVIGVQANLWTEYIPTFAHVEYMVLPRMSALAEVQWTEPEKKEYQGFLARLVPMTALYDDLRYTYSKAIFDISATFTTDTDNGELIATLSAPGEGAIFYTLDGSDPATAGQSYKAPVRIAESATLQAVVVRPSGNSRLFSEEIHFNKATAKPLTLREAPSRGYSFNGGPELTDGMLGGSNYKTGRWLGFQGKNLDAAIDLKVPVEISKVAFRTNVVKGDWIMGAAGVTVKVSADGHHFREVGNKAFPAVNQTDKDGIYTQEITFEPIKARYVDVVIESSRLPAWHGSAGNPAYLFVDEIVIE